MDVPDCISAPSVLRPGTPVRNLVDAPAWAPPPGPGLRPVSTRVRSRCGAIGCRIGENAKSRPVAAGVQCSIAMPLGTYNTPKRRMPRAAVFRTAERAGTMPSSRGRASVAPRPRRTVRRGIAFLVMIMSLAPRLERAGCAGFDHHAA